jgi:hypothetical protein
MKQSHTPEVLNQPHIFNATLQVCGQVVMVNVVYESFAMGQLIKENLKPYVNDEFAKYG